MNAGLQKLKEKMELQPKYVATQQKVISNPIFTFDLNPYISADSIVEICTKYRTNEYKEKRSESVYAWRSDYYFVSKNPMVEFNSLFDIVTNKAKSIKQVENINYSFLVDHFWFAIYNKGDNSKVHNHGWVDYACVYYAAVPKNSSPLLIPSMNGDITIFPKTGMLVVMPGMCDHRVPESNHEGDRIIVAMNLIKNQLFAV